MRLLIKNGSIADGSGGALRSGNLLLDGDTVAAVTDGCPPADITIDARGLIVCPGFIDTHSHSDLQALLSPAILPKLYQGITTEVLGQDGVSMAPLPNEHITAWRQNLGGLEGDSDQPDWKRLTRTENYLRMLEEVRPCANYAYLAPHGNIRLEAMGFSPNEATDAQLANMLDILKRELDAGAIGLSTGLVYVPCVYSGKKELILLCEEVARRCGVFVVHQRYESDRILDSLGELLEISLETGVHLHISHFKITGARNKEKRHAAFELIERFRDKGVLFTADQYPYIAGSTMLGRIIPPWAHAGGTAALLERLNDPASRERIKEDIRNTTSVWDNMVSVCTENGIVVTSVNLPENQWTVGKSIVEIGELSSLDPLDAAMDLLLAEENKVGMICKNGVEEVMLDIMKKEYVNVCTDGLLGGTPHPRVYGAFPRVLGKYVREEKTLGLCEAIRKMTSQAAFAMGITDRGIIKEGYKADIVLFDQNEIADVGDYANPRQFARGIRYVIVNGSITLAENTVNVSASAGRVIRA